MRPANLKTRIFLDSGDPQETRELISLLGFLDGQTTNPTLIAKNPETRGKKFTEQEVYDFYKKVVQELSGLMPEGSISIEVYADPNTKAEQMLKQGREFFTWILNAHIKFPTNHEGLKAAEQAVKEGMRINMTLCFSQEQAAAVYAATRGANKGQVFVSPFIGRLDDIRENGMDLIKNIIEMYRNAALKEGEPRPDGRGHMEVLTASVRNMEHMRKALELGSDIITAPFEILKEWASSPHLSSPSPRSLGEAGTSGEELKEGVLKPIQYKELDLNKPWTEFDIRHPLTDKGMQKFSDDWNALIA